MKICIVGMVYKSVRYCNFMVDQLSRFSDPATEIKILANDPTPEVEEHLSKLGIPFMVRRDAHPEAHYLSRVYRGWNKCIEYADSDLAILVNSDMGYSPQWDTALVDSITADSIVTSRLVESGKMPSGTHGISKNFGRSPDDYNESGFLEFAESVKCNRLHAGGLYSPVCLWADKFMKAGGFPEGNIKKVPGDKIAFERCGMQHQTNFNSIVYHIQEGEMDE